MPTTLRDAFDRAARSYDGERRQLIPCFDEFYGNAVALVAEAAGPGARILDLGAGTGLLSALVAEAVPDAEFTLTDLSEAMLAKACERFAAGPAKVSFKVMDHLALDEVESYDVVMSALSIHHLEDVDKRVCYTAMTRAAKPGGLVLNADQVAGDTAAMEERYWRHWYGSVSTTDLPKDAIEAAIRRQRYDKRSPLLPQLDWLHQAGLNEVECRYKNVSFVVLCGVKPA